MCSHFKYVKTWQPSVSGRSVELAGAAGMQICGPSQDTCSQPKFAKIRKLLQNWFWLIVWRQVSENVTKKSPICLQKYLCEKVFVSEQKNSCVEESRAKNRDAAIGKPRKPWGSPRGLPWFFNQAFAFRLLYRKNKLEGSSIQSLLS